MYNKIYHMLMEEAVTNVDTIYNALTTLVRTNKHLKLKRSGNSVELSANESLYPYLKATIRFTPIGGKVRITSTSNDPIFNKAWTNLYRKSWNVFLVNGDEVMPIVYYNFYPIDEMVSVDNQQLLDLVNAFSLDIRDIDTKFVKSGKMKNVVTDYCSDKEVYDDADYSDKQRDLGKFRVRIEHFGRGMVARWLNELKA